MKVLHTLQHCEPELSSTRTPKTQTPDQQESHKRPLEENAAHRLQKSAETLTAPVFLAALSMLFCGIFREKKYIQVVKVQTSKQIQPAQNWKQISRTDQELHHSTKEEASQLHAQVKKSKHFSVTPLEIKPVLEPLMEIKCHQNRRVNCI